MHESEFYHGMYREESLKSIRPGGFIRDFLTRQQNGLSGNHTRQGYPFDTAMWEGIRDIQFKEHEYRGRPLPPPADNTWWPYEQVSYLLDGLVRLGLLMEEAPLVDIFRRQARAFFARRGETGRLGLRNYGLNSEWPFAVFFRAIRAYVEAADGRDEFDAVEKLRRHYHAVPEAELGEEFRNVTNIEGMLAVAGWTGDEALIRKARRVYEIHDRFLRTRDRNGELNRSRLRGDRRLSLHGVTLSEELKLPVLLYLYTGDETLLADAENALRVVLARHEQIPGLPSACEYGQGKDPLQGYESCVISDFTWTLGFFFMATGKVEYADRIEKIIFNALPGAITKDFTNLQYFSSPNQVVATPFSNHTLFMRGFSPLRQYRPDHFAQCCPGNIHRAMPIYAGRMWMSAPDGSPVAVLLGGSEYTFLRHGRRIRIEEDTGYPYDEKIVFRIRGARQTSFPLTIRIPAWSRDPQLTFRGRSRPVAPGTMLRIEESWNDGEELLLTLPMTAELKRDRQWRWVERGPLVYALEIPCRTEWECGGDRFSARSLHPSGRWNFALPDDARLSVTETPERRGEYPLEHPPVKVTVSAREVTGFDELAEGRYTPPLPLFYRLGGEKTLELVPYGGTLLRLTAFPDTTERIMLPVLTAKTSAAYPYHETLPLEEQVFEPESMDDWELWDRSGDVIQCDGTGYFDLISRFRTAENVLTYLQIRFYSEQAGEAVLALGVSDGCIGWLNGEKILTVEPPVSGEMTAPLWFHVRVRAGHNFLRLKVADGLTPDQHRVSWGAKLEAFRTDV